MTILIRGIGGFLAGSLAAALLLAPLSGAATAQTATPPPACSTGTVGTADGDVCGTVGATSTGKKANAYLGIPFAESTAGGNRWAAPVPRRPWSGTFTATQFGPVCPQVVPTQPMPNPKAKVTALSITVAGSEDCLSVNVWTPETAKSDAGLPVMVYIPGGGFTQDGSASPVYDGAYLAANRNVVLVTLNYRLGVLGFLAGEGLNGNYGFLDQQAALAWVHRNIRAFGGDPGKVTLFGESAGAMSVGLHLFSAPGSQPFFRAAIMESNFLGLPYQTLENAVDVGNLFKQSLNCRDTDCMRAQSVNDLLGAQSRFTPQADTIFTGEKYYLTFAPVIDGTTLLRQPMQAAQSQAPGKPFMIGFNKNEMIPFYQNQPTTPMEYAAATAFLFGRQFQKVVDRYPPKDGPDNWVLTANVYGEQFITCSTLYAATRVDAPVHVYLFAHQPSFPLAGPQCQINDRVCHGVELPFVFHTADQLGATFTPEEARLSDQMTIYWTNFAAHLNPNGEAGKAGDQPQWPAFTAQGRELLTLLLPTPVAVTDPYRDVCPFWDGIGYDLTDPWP
ncbi:hypothetical protein [Azospirillum argentinense]|uniref:carboxylesterase/lipase family protein n=1 Tax=Azospirillum argentinense TaxID=2970906 RepID=UPI0032E0543A